MGNFHQNLKSLHIFWFFFASLREQTGADAGILFSSAARAFQFTVILTLLEIVVNDGALLFLADAENVECSEDIGWMGFSRHLWCMVSSLRL